MDTYEISMIYRARPVVMQALRMGQWFLNATGINDPQLYYSTQSDEIKRLLIERGYAAKADASVLRAYNDQFRDE